MKRGFKKPHVILIILVSLFSFPLAARYGYRTAVHWTPTGAEPRIETPQCQTERIEKTFLDPSLSLFDKAQWMQDRLRACSTPWRSLRGPNWWPLIVMESMVHDIADNPRLRAIRIPLANGEIVPAMIGIKPGGPRPLVILKCGFLCNSKRAIPFTLMHFFDEGPFNVLFLGNTSGPEYVLTNKEFIFGGFHEGMQVVKVAAYLRSSASPYRKKITSIHFVGVSLGGQAALYSSLFNDAYPGRGPLRSIVAICPAVDLKATISSDLVTNLRGRVFNYKIRSTVDTVKAEWPQLITDLQLAGRPAPAITQWPDLLASAAAHFLSRHRLQKHFLRPFQDVHIENAGDFWTANNFIAAMRPIRTPTLAIGARNDPIVPYPLNFKNLLSYYGDQPQSGLQPILTSDGSHCGFSLVYGWRVMGTLLRSFVMSRSPRLLQSRREHHEAVPAEWPNWFHSFNPQDKMVGQSWLITAGKDAILRIEAEGAGGPFSIPLRVDVDRFNNGYDLSKPLDRQIFNRWLNANVRIDWPEFESLAPQKISRSRIPLRWTSYDPL